MHKTTACFVDVVELPEPTLEGGPIDLEAVPPQSGSPLTSANDLDDTEYRPLKGGARVQIALSGAGLGTPLAAISVDFRAPLL